jgi:glycosyltransferase involved in cell wall biosynthesis
MTPNKRIGLLITPMTGNGGDRVVLNLSQAFAKLGYRVDLVVPEVTDYHRRIMESLPSEIRTVDFKLPVTRWIYFRKLFKLKQYLEQTEPLVLLANGDYVGLANAAKKISCSKTKIIQVVHVSVSHYFDNLTSLRTRLKCFFLKQFYRSSDGIITVSQGVAQDLSQLTNIPLKRIQTIYNPIVTPDLIEQAKLPLSHPWFMPEQPPVILGAGRLHPQKDFATLIRAFAKLRQRRSARLLIIGGEPDQKAMLQNLIRELHLEQDAQLFGFSDNPYAFMSHAAVFALSSQYEGFGNVLVEAMATGTPVVSTDCKSGPAEILDYGKYGKLTPVGDPDALAEALLETLDKPVDCKTLQSRADEFTDMAIANQYIDFIKKLVY